MPANPDPDHTILSYSISKLGRAISVADDQMTFSTSIDPLKSMVTVLA